MLLLCLLAIADDRDDVKRVLDGANPALRACFDGRLAERPGLSGAWRISFVATVTGGAARDVRVEPVETADTTLERCLTGVVGGLVFPPMTQDQPVTKRYRFG